MKKNLQNTVLVFTFFCMSNLLAGEVVELDSSLTDAISALRDAFEADTALYAELQDELMDAYIQFDESAHERRHLNCCLNYKFDLINKQFQKREQDLLAQIAERDQALAEWQERYELFRIEAAAEIDSLYSMIEMLALQLDSRENRDPVYLTNDDLAILFQDLMDRYLDMKEQRDNCIALIEKLNEKIDGHFEIEAIENAVLGEQICGVLYCPELDELDQESDLFSDDASEIVEVEVQHYELTDEFDEIDGEELDFDEMDF